MLRHFPIRRPQKSWAGFPTTIDVNGIPCTICTSYRVVFAWLALMDNPLLDLECKINGTFIMFFYVWPPDGAEAWKGLQRFLLCGKPRDHDPMAHKVYDFTKDYQTIWSGFHREHGIDLNRDLTMHWWAFKALFDELTDKTKIKQIIQIREMPYPDVKDASYNQVAMLKEKYSLEG